MRTDETNALPLVGESASRPSNAAVSDDRTDEISEDAARHQDREDVRETDEHVPAGRTGARSRKDVHG